MNEWVDYTKQRPEQAGFYLVCRNNGMFQKDDINYIFISRFITSGCTENGYFEANCVTHWMPLPEMISIKTSCGVVNLTEELK